jgi:branched-chain amino acid aminotransferase
MQNVLVNFNGEILPWNQADRVSVLDRSYLYGDSLYEVVRTFDGIPVHLREHLDRLYASARLCQMEVAQTPELWVREIRKTVDAFHKLPGCHQSEAYVRMVLSRGTGKIGFGLQNLLTPSQYSLIVQPLEAPDSKAFEKGAHLGISKRIRNDRRALDPAMKSGNYLNSLLAYLETTQDSPYGDAILLDRMDFVTEGTTFNLFYVKKRIVVTSPLDIGILDGITRKFTLENARNEGFETREVRFKKEHLFEADEVFLTSTTKDVFPVTAIDGKRIANGKPGKVTRLLKESFNARIPEFKNAALAYFPDAH